MNHSVDPRALGFSYNAQNESRKPAFFKTAEKIAFMLGRQAGELEQQAWDLEMAIKDVRIASNTAEKTMALADLEKELAKHLPQH